MLTIKIRSRPGMTPIVERRFENENDPEAARLSAFYARLGAYSEWERDGGSASAQDGANVAGEATERVPDSMENAEPDTDSDPVADGRACPLCGWGGSIDGPQVEVHDDLFECCDDGTGGCGRTWWERQRDGQPFPGDRCGRCGNDSRLEFDGENDDGLIDPRYVCESCAYSYWFDGDAIREFGHMEGERR